MEKKYRGQVISIDAEVRDGLRKRYPFLSYNKAIQQLFRDVDELRGEQFTKKDILIWMENKFASLEKEFTKKFKDHFSEE